MNKEQKVRLIRQYIINFGPGFHPDNDPEGYDPPLSIEELKEYNSILDIMDSIDENELYDILLPAQAFIMNYKQ